MAFLRKLKDLITLSHETPVYTENPDMQTSLPPVDEGMTPEERAKLGPLASGPLADLWRQPMSTPNPAGPLKEIGTRREPTGFGRAVRAQLPGIIDAAITAGATPNIAGGGPVDIFRAMHAVSTDHDTKRMLALREADILAQQHQREAMAQNYPARRDQYQQQIDEKARNDQGNLGIRQQVANTGAERSKSLGNYQQNRTALDYTKAGLIPPFSHPSIPGGVVQGPTEGSGEGPAPEPTPAVTPIPEAQLPPKQQADLEASRARAKLTGAQTGLAGARTDVLGQEKPITNEFEAYMKRFNGDAEKATLAYNEEMAKRALASRPPKDEIPRSDKSYQFSVGELNKVGKPVEDMAGRIGRLEDTIAQNSPQADALIAPELLTVMAGGQGSGLRMNEAEIARIVGGRSHWESLKASINKWQLDPKKATSITPAQRQQIRDLVSVVVQKARAKRALLNDAHQALLASEDPAQHRQIVADTRKKFSDIDEQHGASGEVIKVKRKSDGLVGSMPAEKFDPTKYDKVP